MMFYLPFTELVDLVWVKSAVLTNIKHQGIAKWLKVALQCLFGGFKVFSKIDLLSRNVPQDDPAQSQEDTEDSESGLIKGVKWGV